MTQTTTTETTTTNAVQTAQAKIQNIQTSIINGDKSLTSRDLASAKAELEFIQLQEEAREIIATETAESERKAHLLNLQKRLKVIADSHKVIDSKLESFTKSLREYLTACTTFQTNLNDIRAGLREAALYPETDVIFAGVPAGKLAFGVQIQDRLRTLTIGTISVTNLNPADSIKPILEKSVADYERNF
jgi:chromosome segregation ATPase